MESITLSAAEIEALTGHKRATKQLAILHFRGFTRAYIGRDGVVLSRVHYEAVERGELQAPRKAANLSFLKSA